MTQLLFFTALSLTASVVCISSKLSTAVLSKACIGTHYPKIEDGSAVLVFCLKTDSTTIHLVPSDER